MTTVRAQTVPRLQPARPNSSTSAPSLRSVPRGRTRPARAPFVFVVVGLLTAGLVGLLLLNTALAQGSFRLHDLQHRSAALSDEEQQLQLAVDAAGTPAHLARAARRLGLVPARDPGFLLLDSGKLLGAPKPASAPAPPSPPRIQVAGTAAAANGARAHNAAATKQYTKQVKQHATRHPTQHRATHPATNPAKHSTHPRGRRHRSRG